MLKIIKWAQKCNAAARLDRVDRVDRVDRIDRIDR